MSELPQAFCMRIRAQFPTMAEEFLRALDSSPRSSVRYNSSKPSAVFPFVDAVPWNTEGYWLHERPAFTLDPLFHAGCYYPQEGSSMFLQWVLRQVVPLDKQLLALDLCAAPGGKSLILSDYLRSSGVVISNEIIPARARTLREVVTKWGAGNVVVTSGSPQSMGELGGWFDLIVVDAPCSGEGMFRKDPAARDEWNEQSAQNCSIRQQDILSGILPSLKEDGILIYSTCTFAQEENERILGALVDTGDYESIRFQVPANWSVDVPDSAEVFACRFLPHLSAGEGFFIGALRKKSATTPARIKSKAVFKAADAAALTSLKPWCKSLLHPVLAPDGYLYDSTLDLNQLNTLATQVYVLQPGIQLGKTVRNDFIPDHGLAMSRSVMETVQRVEVNEQQALQYLRGESLQLTAEGISGWCLASYQGHPLGWMKLIGARVNNYYPKEWRVRMR